MKKTVFLITLFFTSFLFAKEFNFSVTPTTGITFGKNGEYLYSSFSNYLLSYLEWEEKPLFMEGITFSADYKNNTIDFSFNAALPVKCGQMTDSDWKSYNIKTNYSIFDSYTVFAGNMQARYGYSFEYKDFTFGPGASLNLEYKSFSGKNGYGWNGGNQAWNTEGLPKKRYSGIDYQQLCGAVTLETSGAYRIKNLAIKLLLGASPFTIAQVTDYHRDENKYEDPSKAQDFTTISFHMAFFKRYRGELGIEYLLSDKISLCSTLSGLAIFNIKGPTKSDVWSTKGNFEELYQNSGMDVYELNWKVGVKFEL